MYKKSILIWAIIIPLAFLNGALRELVIEPLIGYKYANPISCFILCCLAFIVSFLLIPRLGKGTSKVYIKMGLLWVLLTIVFETVLGLLIGNSFQEIINAYNITSGNFWLLVVIFIGFIPFLVGKLKSLSTKSVTLWTDS